MVDRPHHTKDHPRFLGPGTGERKGNNSTPCLKTWAIRTQSSTSCDPPKSTTARLLGTIVLREWSKKAREGEAEWLEVILVRNWLS